MAQAPAEMTDVSSAVAAMNSALAGGVTPYRLDIVDPKVLLAAEVNAQVMDKEQFGQLVNNVKGDGNLSSVPFCWRDPNGATHILSGHHRVEAAIVAGIERILIMFVSGELSEAKRTAIQISHNAIAGSPDLTILKAQFLSIADMADKIYTGLDDRTFINFKPPTIATFNEAAMLTQKVELVFVGAQAAEIEREVLALENKSQRIFVGLTTQAEPLKVALMQVKESSKVFNTSVAFSVLAALGRIYSEYLDDLEAGRPIGTDLSALHARMQSELES